MKILVVVKDTHTQANTYHTYILYIHPGDGVLEVVACCSEQPMLPALTAVILSPAFPLTGTPSS